MINKINKLNAFFQFRKLNKYWFTNLVAVASNPIPVTEAFRVIFKKTYTCY